MSEKAKKKAPAKKAAKKAAPPKREKPEFGVEALAKRLNVEVATCRAKLRSAEVDKGEGGVYDFGSKAGVEKVAKQLEAEKADA